MNESSLDNLERDYILLNIVSNSNVIKLNDQKDTTSLTYILAGSIVYDPTLYKTSVINSIIVKVSSGVLSDAMTVQVYDFTNATEISTLSFSTAEDNSIKLSDITNYMKALTADTLIQIRIKSGAGASVEVLASMLQVKGIFI